MAKYPVFEAAHLQTAHKAKRTRIVPTLAPFIPTMLHKPPTTTTIEDDRCKSGILCIEAQTPLSHNIHLTLPRKDRSTEHLYGVGRGMEETVATVTYLVCN